MKKLLVMLLAIAGISVASAQNNNSDKVTVTIDNAKTITLSKVGIKSMVSSLELLIPQEDLVTLTNYVAEVETKKVKTYEYEEMTLHFDLNKGIITFKGHGHIVKVNNMYQLIQYFNL